MNTLNIFCDASILIDERLNKETIGCPGYLCMKFQGKEQVVFDKDSMIIRNTTNNEAEICAIMMGVRKAVELRNDFKHINLFSDSRICIQSLKDWIFKWVNKAGPDGVLYGSNNKSVSNQHVITRVVKTIIDNDLSISFWHQKGHVNTRVQSHIDRARQLFIKENKVNVITDDFIKTISYYNNEIDLYTKQVLRESIQYLHPRYKDIYGEKDYVISYILNKDMMYKYRSLINV